MLYAKLQSYFGEEFLIHSYRGLGIVESKIKIDLYKQKNLDVAQNQRVYKEISGASTKNLGIKDKSQDKIVLLLGFIPSSSFYSQRPSIWWTRKHDSDLIKGVYQYGYRGQRSVFQGFIYILKLLRISISETLSKRVKKLVQIVQKFHGFYDFDNLAQSDDEEEKSWSIVEEQSLFNLLCDYDVSIGVDRIKRQADDEDQQI